MSATVTLFLIFLMLLCHFMQPISTDVKKTKRRPERRPKKIWLMWLLRKRSRRTSEVCVWSRLGDLRKFKDIILFGRQIFFLRICKCGSNTALSLSTSFQLNSLAVKRMRKRPVPRQRQICVMWWSQTLLRVMYGRNSMEERRTGKKLAGNRSRTTPTLTWHERCLTSRKSWFSQVREQRSVHVASLSIKTMLCLINGSKQILVLKLNRWPQ